MKKFILSLILSAALFGCDKESGQEPDNGNTTGEDREVISSLEDTSWKLRSKTPDLWGETKPGSGVYEIIEGIWHDYELTFTATHCTFTITGEDGIPHGETNAYTYDPPKVVIASPIGVDGTGTVKNGSMDVVIWMTQDICWDMELKKQ